MTQIKNIDVLILEPSDIIKRFQSDFDVTNLKGFIKYFNFDARKSVFNSSMVLFIDDGGNTTILKNRYGNAQI